MLRPKLAGGLAVLLAWVCPSLLAQSAESCKLCHDAIYEEWRGSMHAKAWTDPVFQRFLSTRETQGLETESCKPCHVPQPILLTGVGKMPKVRTEDLDEGVTCVTCHKGEDGAFHGPFVAKADTEALQYVHPSVHDARHSTHEICASCHGQKDVPAHDQLTSYLSTPLRDNGVTCQQCHMPYVERPAARKDLYPTLENRPGGSHLWPGSSDLGQLQQAFEYETGTDEGKFVLGVKNNAGHFVPPTYGRILVFEVAFLAGDQVLETSSVELSMMNETRLEPLGWNYFDLPLPEGARRVRVRTLHRRMPFAEPVEVGVHEADLE